MLVDSRVPPRSSFELTDLILVEVRLFMRKASKNLL